MAKLTIKPRRPLTIFLGPAHDADRLRACGRGRVIHKVSMCTFFSESWFILFGWTQYRRLSCLIRRKRFSKQPSPGFLA